MSRLFGVGLFVIDSILDMFWALCRVLYLCSVYINKKPLIINDYQGFILCLSLDFIITSGRSRR